MKKFMSLALMLSLLMFIVSFSNATELKKSGPKVKAAEIKTFEGSIESIKSCDTAKKINIEITVLKKDNQKITLTLVTSTKIRDAEGKAITSDKLKNGDRIYGKFIVAKSGFNQVRFIKQVK